MRTSAASAPRGPSGVLGAVVWLSVSVSGCGRTSQPFEPAYASGSANATYGAKRFELRTPSTDLVEVLVWSRGVSTSGPHGFIASQITVLNATNGRMPVDVHDASVDVTFRDGRTAYLEAARDVESSVRPRSHGQIDLRFELPGGVDPTDVARFDFHWRLSTPMRGFRGSATFVPSEAPTSWAFQDHDVTCVGAYGFTHPENCPNPTPVVTE